MKDLHVHTVYSDGENTPEEMVLSAIEKGLDTLGFSDHSYTSFDGSCCMKKEEVSRYREEIAALKEKYRGKIEILCGIEQDYYSDFPALGVDYIIGSVHYLYKDGEYLTLDYKPEILAAAREHFGGDMLALAEEYYLRVSELPEVTGAHIIGHFDLITKFNDILPLVDESAPRYRAAWKRAADRLLSLDLPFEVNTGAMSRGYRKTPYPSEEIRRYILQNGGKLILSSDSHSARNIAYGFEKFA